MREINNILIVGANFTNKGAQSMLFICVDEIKKHNPKSVVYFACNGEKYNENEYGFERVLYSISTQEAALSKRMPVISVLKSFTKDCVKWLVGRHNNLWQILDLRNIMPKIDVIIDVSGYALGSISSTIEHEYYLNNIRLAKKYEIPIILMPQSFGPFDYDSDKEYLIKEISALISYPSILFAREKEGKRQLEEKFHVQNVVLSTDLVLQNKGINIKNIFINGYTPEILRISTNNNVAIIPNYHCFRGELKERTLNIYKGIINCLLEKGKEIYVFRHSTGDLDACKDIKGLFLHDNRVHLIEEEFSCIEYDEFISNFQFIVCSRYHGCVHAYRNLIPNIILGWAVKYRELAELLSQEKYIFDINGASVDVEAIIDAVTRLCSEYPNEMKIISRELISIQKNNCFDMVEVMLGIKNSTRQI